MRSSNLLPGFRPRAKAIIGRRFIHAYDHATGSAAANCAAIAGKHHEIYLSDIRRGDPSKWKTIIREPFGTVQLNRHDQ